MEGAKSVEYKCDEPNSGAKGCIWRKKKHMAAGDESIARLVVKEGQKIVLDLNGYTIAKKRSRNAW